MKTTQRTPEGCLWPVPFVPIVNFFWYRPSPCDDWVKPLVPFVPLFSGQTCGEVSLEEQSAGYTAGSSTLIFNGTNGFLVQMAEYYGSRCTKVNECFGTDGSSLTCISVRHEHTSLTVIPVLARCQHV